MKTMSSKLFVKRDAGIRGILKRIMRSNLSILTILFVFVLILGSFSSPMFMQPGNWINILRAGSIVGIIGLGATAILLVGEMDLSMGASMSFVTLAGALSLKWVPHDSLAILITLVVAILVGVLNGLLITRLRITAIMATLGTMNLYSGLAYLLTAGLPIYLYEAPTYLFMGKGLLFGLPVSFLIFLGLSLFMIVILQFTTFGKKFYFTGANSLSAWLSGLNTSAIKIIAFAFSGICCAISGILLGAQTNQLIPTLGIGYELSGIAIAVLGGTMIGGGRGSVIGTFLGTGIYQMLLNILALSGLGTYIEQILRGCMLVIIVVVYASLNKSKEGER